MIFVLSSGLPGPALVEFLDEEHGGYKTPEADASITFAPTLGSRLIRKLVLHDFQKAEVILGNLSKVLQNPSDCSPINTFESIPLHEIRFIAVLNVNFSKTSTCNMRSE